MSLEAGIFLGTIALVILTSIVVAYTGFGRDVRGPFVTAAKTIWRGGAHVFRRMTRFDTSRRLFWATALLVLAVWLLTLTASRNYSIPLPIGMLLL